MATTAKPSRRRTWQRDFKMSSSEKNSSEKNSINIEPHWPGVFSLAIGLVNRSMTGDDGRELVVEMLDYGRRLSERQVNKIETE